jgi:Flp pilus assembly protein TadD
VPYEFEAQAERDRVQREKYEQAMAEKRAFEAQAKRDRVQRQKYDRAMVEKRAARPQTNSHNPICASRALETAIIQDGAKVSTSNDADIEDRKVAEIKRLLSEKRFDEAFDRSTALTIEAPGNVEGWWRLTLAAKGLKRWEVARSAVKETINLVPRWPIAWGNSETFSKHWNKMTKPEKLLRRGSKLIRITDMGTWVSCSSAKERKNMMALSFMDRL